MRITEKWREEIAKGSMPANVLKMYTPEIVTTEDAGVRKAAFVISTEAEDRDGDTVSVKGWELDSYRKNPVVLWAHDTKSLPIARAESIGARDGKLKSVTVFPEKGIYPFADQVYGLVKGGFLNGTSVGFHPLEATPRGKSKGVNFTRQELYEFSILPVPSNREALREAKEAGHDIEFVVKWAEEFLEYAQESGLLVPVMRIKKALREAGPIVVSVPVMPPSETKSTSEGHAVAGAEASDDFAEMMKSIGELVTKEAEPEVIKYIKEENGKYCVYSESGKKLGEHATKAEALAQLRAIEANKHSAAPKGVAKADKGAMMEIADDLFGEGGVFKAAPPWMQEGPKKDSEPDPKDAAEPVEQAAGEAPEGGKPPAGGPGETPNAPSSGGASAHAGAKGNSAQLFQQLQAEVQPLEVGGDPTQVATALKAALEKFAASFMQAYAVPAAQASPAGPSATPATPQAPPSPAAPPAQPTGGLPPNPAPTPPGTVPQGQEPAKPFPPKKEAGIELDHDAILKGFEDGSLTPEDLRATITSAVKKNFDAARMQLSGKLPD